MNISILTGHLGADPESKYTQDSLHVASFSIAFNFGQKKTGWIRVTCFEKLADSAAKYLHKGAKVAVVCELQQDKWTTETGENKSTFKLVARNLEFIKTDGRGFDNAQAGEGGNVDDEVPF